MVVEVVKINVLLMPIEMIYDEDGFLYPNILSDLCINCGMCINVCQANEAPILRRTESIRLVWDKMILRIKKFFWWNVYINGS